MKYILSLILVASVVSCGTDIEDVDPEAPVTEETKEELKRLITDVQFSLHLGNVKKMKEKRGHYHY